MTFYNLKKQYDNFDFDEFSNSVECLDIEKILQKDSLSATDFLSLLTPKALVFVEQMAQKAHEISVRQFGKNIILYAPLYVSNFCINNCVYCGFSTTNNIKREILTFEEIEQNCKVICEYGIRHILLVCGESPEKTSLDYLEKCILVLKKYFECIDIEIYPLDVKGYEKLQSAGAEGLTIYQETYDKKLYKTLHTKGAKSNYEYRLETCQRAGLANFRNLNVGTLLGLNDFISEIFFTGLHAKYLQDFFPSCEIGMSFPRLRPTISHYQPKTQISDKKLVQAICAVRLFINRINITVSTRESNEFRKKLVPLGITKMSAASRVEVGGYTKNYGDGQFKVNDTTTVNEVKEMIYKAGYQPVLKDWMIL
ncbi:MAG: 2-iminoacetate synthase ThiH [Elusimicrobiota bacterium]|jgi:2-iminoacetate synthase|nr:2-iminoacetate synthase ThiH [Elusimicrobiota bacterium]